MTQKIRGQGVPLPPFLIHTSQHFFVQERLLLPLGFGEGVSVLEVEPQPFVSASVTPEV